MKTFVRSRIAAGAILAIVSLALTTSGALALPPIDHENPYFTGEYGVHSLIDEGEPYGGAACFYDAGHLDSVRVRRPIAYAAHSGSQELGWRYEIQGTNDDPNSNPTWHRIVLSPVEKATAPDKQPAPFLNGTQALSDLTYTYVRVLVRMIWLTSGHVTGQAFLAVESYEDEFGVATWTDFCPATIVTNAAAAPVHAGSNPPNAEKKYVTGNYGVNMLIDESDTWGFSGGACFFNGSTHDLRKIRIRQPIAFPVGPAQYIGWRYVIEGTNGDPFSQDAGYTQVAKGPLEKVWAAKRQVAPFTAKSYTFDAPLMFTYYRAVARVYWYEPSNQVDGKSFMAIESYDDGADTSSEGYQFACPKEEMN